MSKPCFLTLEEVLAIHEDQIHRYGGLAGIRDIGLLQSAIAQPAAVFRGRYLHANLFQMAAAYAYHLALNHPFNDGNKRTALVSMLIFLRFNDIHLTCSDSQLEELILAVVNKKKNKAGIAATLRKAHIR